MSKFNNNVPIISLYINHAPVSTLVDSGATVSLININIAKHLNINPVSDVNVVSASDHVIPILGRCQVPIALSNDIIQLPMYVTNVLPHNYSIILGSDILKREKAIISWTNQTLKMFNHSFLFNCTDFSNK